MKCLYFLYGEKRTFETARKFWNILDIPNLDIVIHTPNTTSDYLGSSNFESVTEKDFDVLDNPKVFLYNRNSYKVTDNRTPHFSWRFLSKYLSDTTKVYDYIFVGRLDSTFYVNEWSSIPSTINNEIVILRPAKGKIFMPDHSYFGNQYIIKKFVDNLPDRKFWTNDPHKAMCDYIGDNYNELLWGKGDDIFESQHIRPNMVKYFEKYFNVYGKLKEIDTQYFNFIKNFKSKYEYKLDIEYKKNYRIDWVKDYKFKNNELNEMFLEFSKNI